VLVALAFGVCLAVSMRLLKNSGDVLHRLGSLGAPWLVCAFAVGAVVRGRRHAALAGSLALVAAVFTYYVLESLVERRTGLGYAVPIGFAWSLAAIVVGAAFGFLGGLWRDHRRGASLAAGVISGALVGEALLLLAWRSDAERPVLVSELIAGLVLPFVLARRRELVPAVASTGVVAVALAVTEGVLLLTMRRFGWADP
jgi:hypothetical protein